MSSRDKDQSALHHQPLLSSLVVRATDSDGGGGGGGTASIGGGRISDYEPGEVRREPPSYSRSERYSVDPGYRIRAGSGSPIRRRDQDHRYVSNFDHSGGLPRTREFGGGRDIGRYRNSSPPFGRGGKRGGRPVGRGFDEPRFAPGPQRGEHIRNNPNVRPREGDWYCADPACNNLNFARREYCNSCNKSRPVLGASSPRGYSGPPPLHAPPRRFPGLPMDRSPGRITNGYRSPPRGWARNGPRELGAADLPPPRYESRFLDHHPRRERLDHPEDYFRGRTKLDRPIPGDWSHRDRGRDSLFSERRGLERRPPLSPPPPLPLPPQRGRWERDVRERSRSPIRGALPPKDYQRDLFLGRGRDDRRAVGRERIGDPY